MTIFLYIATAVGLFVATQTNGNWNIVRQTLKGQSLTSVAVSEGVILAGTRGGIRRSTDKGHTWEKADKNFSIGHVRWMSTALNRETILVGTEPAGIYVSHDDGITWSKSRKVDELRDKHGWFLPYSPEAGCVRGFAVTGAGQQQARIYAAVEVGGVLVSGDRGKKWELVQGSDGKPDIHRELGTMIHPDVHSISVHPASSDLVTAATGGGLYRSVDGGGSWTNLYRCYIRAIWVDPVDSKHMIAGPADGVSRNGRIEESYDGGRTWQHTSAGLRTPWPRHMVERFVQVDRNLFAILSNGELWLKQLDEPTWQHVLPELAQIKALAAGS